jgi:hypothetical protein
MFFRNFGLGSVGGRADREACKQTTTMTAAV